MFKRRTQKISKNNKGFSLVEVLVAVGIFGIIVGPFLAGFTQSAVMNARARKMEEATTAGQNVMEKIRNAKTEELIDTTGASPYGAVASDLHDEIGAPSGHNGTRITWSDTVNGRDYTIYSFIDPTNDTYDDTNAAAAENFNEYTDYNKTPIANIYAMSGGQDGAYMLGTDADDAAVTRFPGAPLTVMAGMKRNAIIDIRKVGDEKTVNISVEYTYGTDTYTTIASQPIYANKEADVELRNIFLYFTPMTYKSFSGETITIRNWNNIPVRVFLVRQGEEDGTFGTYKVDVKVYEPGNTTGEAVTTLRTNLANGVAANGAALDNVDVYYGKDAAAENYAQTGIFGTAEEYLGLVDLSDKQVEERAYQVTVQVYEQGKDTIGVDNAILTLTGSKEK